MKEKKINGWTVKIVAQKKNFTETKKNWKNFENFLKMFQNSQILQNGLKYRQVYQFVSPNFCKFFKLAQWSQTLSNVPIRGEIQKNPIL